MAIRNMPSRFPGKCAQCGASFPKGTPIAFDTVTRKASHQTCAASAPATAPATQAQAPQPVQPAQEPTGAASTGWAPHVDRRKPTKPYAFSTRHASLYELLDALIDYDESGAASPIGNTSHDEGAHAEQWTQCATFADAVKVAREGFTEIRPQVDAITNAITSEVVAREVPRVKRRNAIAGGAVNVGRVMTGAPKCFTQYTRIMAPGVARVLRIAVSVSNVADVPNEMIRARGAAIVALIDALTRKGWACEVWAVAASEISGTSTIVSTEVCLQSASDPLDVDGLMFNLAHPSMFRRMIFAERERNGEALRPLGLISAGWSSSVNPHDDGTFDLIIKGVDGNRLSAYPQTVEQWATQVEHWLAEATQERTGAA